MTDAYLSAGEPDAPLGEGYPEDCSQAMGWERPSQILLAPVRVRWEVGQDGGAVSREPCSASKETHIGRKWKTQLGLGGYEKARWSSPSGRPSRGPPVSLSL